MLLLQSKIEKPLIRATGYAQSYFCFGQVLLVTTKPLGGGSPVRSVYFVAEQDPEKAKAIIGAMMAPNEKVEAWGRLPEAAVKALGLKPGDFQHG
jgi:hypothetical protein